MPRTSMQHPGFFDEDGNNLRSASSNAAATIIVDGFNAMQKAKQDSIEAFNKNNNLDDIDSLLRNNPYDESDPSWDVYNSNVLAIKDLLAKEIKKRKAGRG